jgi:hypothetical protein
MSENLPAVSAPQPLREVSVFSSSGFEIGQRMARALASSNMVPLDYQGNIGNCMILLETAQRMQMSVLAIASNLHIIHGRPGWSATFIASAINASGLFTPIRFDWRGDEGKDSRACRVRCSETATGEVLFGPWVSVAMAKAEGWYGRKGSKWATMTEMMLQYRAISFFGRIYAPHILSGMAMSTDDIADAIDVTPTREPAPAAAAGEFIPAGTPAAAPAATLSGLNETVRARGRPRGSAKKAADASATPEGTSAPSEPAAPAAGPENGPETPAADAAPAPHLAAVPMPPDHVPTPAPIPPGSDPFF